MVGVRFEPRQSDPGSVILIIFSSLIYFLPEEDGHVIRIEWEVRMLSPIFLVELESILLLNIVPVKFDQH